MKNIWQHEVRKKRNESNVSEHSGGSIEDTGGDRDRQPQREDADNNSSLVNEGNWRSSRKRNIEEVDDQGDDKEDTSSLKKPRMVWSPVLHQQFVAAVNQLGVDKAVPKKILEMMNVPWLMRENVASRLQKYRISLRRLGGVSQHQGNMNRSFMTGQDQNFGPLSSLYEFDLQALAVAGQLPAQSLTQLQAAGLGWPSMLPSLGQQPMLSSSVSWRSDLTGAVAVRNSIPETNSRVLPATHSVFNNFLPDLPQYSFPLASAPWISIPVSASYQEEVNSSDAKGGSSAATMATAGFGNPSYNIFNDFSQQQQHNNNINNKLNDWDLPNIGLVFPDQDAAAASAAFSTSEAYSSSSTQSKRWETDATVVAEHGQNQQLPSRNLNHLNHVYMYGGSVRVAETVTCPPATTLFHEQYNQEELMSAPLKQEGSPSVDDEFDFYGDLDQ